MGFVIIFPFAALAGWSIFAVYRWLRRGGYGREWWQAFAILASVGLALGIWFGFFTKYKMAGIHLEGFPIPVSIESRERPDAPWVKSAMPGPIRLGGWLTDVLSGVAACLAPVAVAMFVKENRGKLSVSLRPKDNQP